MVNKAVDHGGGYDVVAYFTDNPYVYNYPDAYVTAYAGKGDEERIRELGAKGYLSKPVSIGPYMAAVRGLIGRS